MKKHPLISLLPAIFLFILPPCHAAGEARAEAGAGYDVVPSTRLTTLFFLMTGLGGTLGVSALEDRVEIGVEGLAWYAVADEFHLGLSYGGYLKLHPAPLGFSRQMYVRAGVSQLPINDGQTNLYSLGIGREWLTDDQDGPPETVFIELTMTHAERDALESEEDKNEDEGHMLKWIPFLSFGVRY